MHLTRIKLKDGRYLVGYIGSWKPREGYLTLLGSDEKLMFDAMVTAITEDDRTGVIRNKAGKIIAPKIEDVDELQRAKEYLERFN